MRFVLDANILFSAPLKNNFLPLPLLRELRAFLRVPPWFSFSAPPRLCEIKFEMRYILLKGGNHGT